MSNFDITRIEFPEANKLLNVVRTICDRDKKLSLGSALSYIYLEQIDDTTSVLISYIVGNGWLTTYCNTAGVINSSYLFDAEDLLARLEALKSVSSNAGLRLYQTKENLMNVEIILPNKQKSGKSSFKNNIMVNVYNGDISDFTDRYMEQLNQESIGCITVAPRDQFFNICKVINSFSGLRVDTESKPIWFHSFNDSLWITCTDKINSSTGNCMASIRICPSFSTFDFGVIGRQLFKSLYLFVQEVSVYLTDSKVVLKTEGINTAILSRIPPEHALALTKGAPKIILPTEERNNLLTLECTRSFSLTQLLQTVYLSKPKQNSFNNELCLNISNNTLTVSKLSDSKLLEYSQLPIFSSLHSFNDWIPISSNYDMLISSLKLLKEYCEFCRKENDLISGSREANNEEIYSFEDLENEDVNPSMLKEEEQEFIALCSIYSQTGRRSTNYSVIFTVLPSYVISNYQAESCIVRIFVKPLVKNLSTEHNDE
jgi:hypothetical protein